MSRATLAAAKAELLTLIDTDIAGVDEVIGYLPARSTINGGTAVCIYTAGITADFWHIAVAVMKNVTSDMATAQEELDLLMPLIDTATNNGGFGPLAWEIIYPAGSEPPVIVATCVYQVGRQDY